MRCTECGSEMRFTSEPMKERYKGEEFTVTGIERWVCDECGNDVMKAEEADRLGRKLVDAYATRKGLLLPSEIRELRESLGMSQKDFEKLIGVSSPTVSRWETGAVQQSKTADNLMRLIRDVPDARNHMLEKTETQYKSSAYRSEISTANMETARFSIFKFSPESIIELRQNGRDMTSQGAREE